MINSDKTVTRQVIGTFLRVTGALPSLRVEEISAAMLQQVANGFEKEPLDNADLTRIGKAALEAQQ